VSPGRGLFQPPVGATAHPVTVRRTPRHRRVSSRRVTMFTLRAPCRSASVHTTVDRDSRLATDHVGTARSIADVDTAYLTFAWPDAGISLVFRPPPDSAILRPPVYAPALAVRPSTVRRAPHALRLCRVCPRYAALYPDPGRVPSPAAAQGVPGTCLPADASRPRGLPGGTVRAGVARPVHQ